MGWRAPNVRTPPLTTILADEGVAGLSEDLFQGRHAASPEARKVQLTIARTTVALTDLPVNNEQVELEEDLLHQRPRSPSERHDRIEQVWRVCLDSGPNLLDVVGPQQPDTEGLHSRRRRAPDTPWCAFSAAAYSSAPPSVPNTPPELCSHRLPVDLLDSGWMKAPRARAPRLTPRFPRLRGAGHTECHTASTTVLRSGSDAAAEATPPTSRTGTSHAAPY